MDRRRKHPGSPWLLRLLREHAVHTAIVGDTERREALEEERRGRVQDVYVVETETGEVIVYRG